MANKKIKVKLNDLYPAGSIKDWVSGVTFTKNKWEEVNASTWNRLKESKGRLWEELSIPTFISEGEDWEIKKVEHTSLDVDNTSEVVEEKVEDISDEWYASEEE